MRKRALALTSLAAIAGSAWLAAQQPAVPLSIHDEFRLVEVASVSDAMEQCSTTPSTA